MKYKYEAIYTKNKNPEGGANDLKWFTLNFKNCHYSMCSHQEYTLLSYSIKLVRINRICCTVKHHSTIYPRVILHVV